VPFIIYSTTARPSSVRPCTSRKRGDYRPWVLRRTRPRRPGTAERRRRSLQLELRGSSSLRKSQARTAEREEPTEKAILE
jgi:hypothetical protein